MKHIFGIVAVQTVELIFRIVVVFCQDNDGTETTWMHAQKLRLQDVSSPILPVNQINLPPLKSSMLMLLKALAKHEWQDIPSPLKIYALSYLCSKCLETPRFSKYVATLVHSLVESDGQLSFGMVK